MTEARYSRIVRFGCHPGASESRPGAVVQRCGMLLCDRCAERCFCRDSERVTEMAQALSVVNRFRS